MILYNEYRVKRIHKMSCSVKTASIFYLVETDTSKVLEIRKRLPSKFLVEYFPTGFNYVSEEEFYSKPPGTEFDTRLMSPTSKPW